jgi:hypothetical protein
MSEEKRIGKYRTGNNKNNVKNATFFDKNNSPDDQKKRCHKKKT